MPRRTRRRTTSTKRRTAARRGALTRRRKAAARSRAARKGARTRRRRGNPAHRSTRKGGIRRTARRAYTRRRGNPARRRRRRLSNPAFNFKRIMTDTVGLLVPAAGTLFLKNWIASRPTEKDAAGNTVKTVSQTIGPWYPIAFDLAALWTVPRFLLKGGAARYKRDFRTIVSTFLALDVLNLVSFLARRDWSLDDAKLIPAGADNFPEWTSMLTNTQPTSMVAGHPGYQRSYRGALYGAQVPLELPATAGQSATFYDTETGRWLVQAA